ncbi:hypothetical protein OIU84_001514 [Salix udensis]|uniref:Adenine/guanine permease AZG2 n=1 Tax=Salix udensis TaxID=889485 RepID=A0AAD6K706_9ROSI|nr:hypothetical protein OIU84_001514 [Salix udensis]
MKERALSLRNYVLALSLSSPWHISSLLMLLSLAYSGGTCSVSDCSSPANQTAGPDCMLKPNEGYQSCLDKTKSDLVVATLLSAMIGSFAMGILANLPLGLAPGMGPNAFVAYNLVGFHGSGPISYKTAMAIVLVEGCAFFVVSALGLREKLARIIPKPVRLACAAGIGLFIAFVGLQVHQGVGLVGPDQSTLVTVTACSSTNLVTGECISGKMRSPTFWLGSVGLLITCYGLMKKIKGSMIYGIIFVTVISWIRGTGVTYFPDNPVGDNNYKYFKKVVGFHKIQSTAGAISFANFNTSDVWLALVTLFYVDMLGTTGILYTMAEIGGFVNEEGSFEGQYMAFIVDSGSTIVGSTLGVTTAATYAESSAGIREGGRTGLTACSSLGYRTTAGDRRGYDDDGGEEHQLGEHQGSGAGFYHHASDATHLLYSKWGYRRRWTVHCSWLV